MHAVLVAITASACLIVAVLLGTIIRRHLPDHHLEPDTKDTVKLAMGLIATMSALILGLLVSSAKGSYDACRMEVVQIAAKVAYLDRVLTVYGPETAEVRKLFHDSVAEAVGKIWPQTHDGPTQFIPSVSTADTLFRTLQALSPHDDTQRNLKTQALSIVSDLGQAIALLQAQSTPSVSIPIILVVISWLVVIFVSFTLISPPNGTATIALVASTFSVSCAIFLIMELDRPLSGLIRVSSDPLLYVLKQIAP